jgi:DNA transposition AAA+ family ATPase
MLEGGYALEKAPKLGFTVKGFPPELRERFSKRRKEILNIAQRLGVKSQDGLQAVACRSRADKQEMEADLLQARWREEAGPNLQAVRSVIGRADGMTETSSPVSAGDALSYAEEHLFERNSTVDERVLLREALIRGRGRVQLDGLRAEVDSRVQAGDLIRQGEKVASKETLQMEREFTSWALVGRDKCRPLGDASELDPELSEEQRQAVQTLLQSTGRVAVLQGDAGTGKTTALREVVKGIEQTGERLFACAPSSGAADVLRRELTEDADTLQQLLVNERLQRSMQGRVILVDEAGLISVRQMRDLCRIAKANGNRLILVGDTKQHSSVEAGDALRAIQKYCEVETATLKTIRRQLDAAYRKAVSFLAQRKPLQAFEQLEKLGAVKECRSSESLLNKAAEDYVKTVQAGKSCLVISPVWSDIHAFTDQVRVKLKEAGFIRNEERPLSAFASYQWTKAERKEAANYRPGDVLVFHKETNAFAKGESVRVVESQDRNILVERTNGERQGLAPHRQGGFDVGLEREISISVGEKLLLRGNLKSAKLQNGDIVEVASWGADGSIELKDGRTLPAGFRQFSHGYAATSHAAQGKTVDRGILIVSEEGVKAANLRQCYVSNSRFRETQAIYVNDRQAARDAMSTEEERQLAMELIGQRAGMAKRYWQVLEAGEMWRAVRQRVRQALGLKVRGYAG